MNILMVIVSGGWMSKNLSEGFKRMGHEVREFFYGTHMGKDWSTNGLKENHHVNVKLVELAKGLKEDNKLDMIFAVIYDDVLEVNAAKELRKLSVPMVNYHVDLIGQWHRIIRIGKYFDLVACAHRDNWKALKGLNIKPYYMPMAANPINELELKNNSIEFFDGVCYLGAPSPYRIEVLERLKSNLIPLRVYGRNWEKTDPDPANFQSWKKNLHDMFYYLFPIIRNNGLKRLSMAYSWRLRKPYSKLFSLSKGFSSCVVGSYEANEFVSLVRASAINLGFTYFMGQSNTLDEKRQLRLRDFEIPICGGFYLTQSCKQLNELFVPGEHLETWNDFGELLDKVSYYLNHPQERNAIAQSGMEHCLKYHTWENRFKGLLKELNIS